MKLYYYFLFRIYWFFRDVVKEGHKMSLISTSLASVLFLYFIVYTIIGLVYFFKVSTYFSLGLNYKFWIVLIGLVLWLLNYYLYIKPRNFLRQDFKKDKIGGILVLFFIVLLGYLMMVGVNKNREKIIEEKKERMESNR